MSNQAKESAGWGSWIAFVAVMMVLVGLFSMLAGLAAVLDDGFITRGLKDGEIFLLSTKVLGVLWMLLGALVIWAGVALIQGREWARFLTIFLVGLHAVVDLTAVNAHPFLSLIFIVIAITVIYGLTVRWDEAKIGMGD